MANRRPHNPRSPWRILGTLAIGIGLIGMAYGLTLDWGHKPLPSALFMNERVAVERTAESPEPVGPEAPTPAPTPPETGPTPVPEAPARTVVPVTPAVTPLPSLPAADRHGDELYAFVPVVTPTPDPAEDITVTYDYDGDGIPDALALAGGARIDTETVRVYDPTYLSTHGGYPIATRGVCTDTVWRAFAHAGYSLKDMIDADIARNLEDYPRVGGRPDPYIDFRRVPNIAAFMDRYAEVLEIDPDDPDSWQPGDIVVYGANQYHIGVVGDTKGRDGFYLLYNQSQVAPKKVGIFEYGEVTGHYRWNGAEVPEDVKIPWEDPFAE